MSGQVAFDEPVRPAALCILGAAGEEKELNGIGGERDVISDGGGDKIGDEGEFAASDRRVRSRHKNKPTQREREEQEAIDESREKVMKIASVEQIELGKIMELSITGQVLRWARRSKSTGGLSLREAEEWKLKNHSHCSCQNICVRRLTPACWLRRSGKAKIKEYAVQR